MAHAKDDARIDENKSDDILERSKQLRIDSEELQRRFEELSKQCDEAIFHGAKVSEKNSDLDNKKV
jgi:hypothetical protein